MFCYFFVNDDKGTNYSCNNQIFFGESLHKGPDNRCPALCVEVVDNNSRLFYHDLLSAHDVYALARCFKPLAGEGDDGSVNHSILHNNINASSVAIV